jgi:hypothetical protein
MRRTSTLTLPALAVLLLAPAVLSGQSAPTKSDPPLAPATPVLVDGVLDVAVRARRAERLTEPLAFAPTALTAEETPARRLDADGFASSGFAQFMASPAGRVLRVVAGAGMIAGGLAAGSDGGTVVAAVGAVPLLAGTFDFCILSPLFGGPFWGKDIRAAK